MNRTSQQMALLLLVVLPCAQALTLEQKRQQRTSTNVTRPLGAEGFAWPLREGPISLEPDLLFVPMPVGVAASVLVFGVMMLLTWACPWLSWEFKQQHADRVVGAVHAVVATIFGVAAELGTYAMCTVSRSWTITAIQITTGYMLVDLMSMVVCDVWKKWRTSDPLMFAHHIYIIVCFSIGGYFDVSVWFFVIGMINEASTPLLSALFIVKYIDPQSKYLMPIGMGFALIFFICRIMFIPYSYYQYAQLGFCDGGSNMQMISAAMVKPAYAFIYGLNCYWFYRTIMGAMKAVNKKPEKVTGTLQETLQAEEAPSLWTQSFKAAPRAGQYRYRLRSLWEAPQP